MTAGFSSDSGEGERAYGQADVWEVNGDQEEKRGGKGEDTHV